VMGLLHEAGARVSYADPYVPKLSASQWSGHYDLESQPLTAAAMAGVDCVAILTDHRSVDYNHLAAIASLIVDTRNAIPTRHPHVFRLGAPSGAAAAARDLIAQ
jgi:UDP-N-acetyl-D-glucosamine dehydrogenase